MIYTLGYTGMKFAELEGLVSDLSAVLIDIRYSPRSRFHHQWNKKNLQDKLKSNYIHVVEMGNVNYKNGGEFSLLNPERGLEVIAPLLYQYQNIVLMCACKHVDLCHRKLVAEIVQKEFGGEVSHLPK